MSRKFIFSLITLLVIGVGIVGLIYLNQDSNAGGYKPPAQSNATYSLRLLSGDKYALDIPQKMSLSIVDQNNAVLKDFDSSDDEILHLTVVRKDRTNFQHLHPKFDRENGTFTQQVAFEANGDYRVSTSYATKGAQAGQDGLKLSTTVYKDVQVGDISGYLPPEALAINKRAATSNGFVASFFFPPNDDSIGPTNTSFYAEGKSTVLISVERGNQAFKNLESYHGSLGRLTVLGPDLELLTFNAMANEGGEQTGLLTFPITFPKSGLYKLFLQTQANEQLSTFEFALQVKERPTSISPKPAQ